MRGLWLGIAVKKLANFSQVLTISVDNERSEVRGEESFLSNSFLNKITHLTLATRLCSLQFQLQLWTSSNNYKIVPLIKSTKYNEK